MCRASAIQPCMDQTQDMEMECSTTITNTYNGNDKHVGHQDVNMCENFGMDATMKNCTYTFKGLKN